MILETNKQTTNKQNKNKLKIIAKTEKNFEYFFF